MEDRNKILARELGELIRIQSISEYERVDVDLFHKVHSKLKELFPNLFSKCEVKEFNGSLLLKWTGSTENDPVLFMNHHDVVEAKGEWKHSPFSGEIIDNKIWGRGTLDDKGGLYCMLKAGEELMSSGFIPRQDIYFLTSCTEETTGEGCDAIAHYLLENNIHFRYTLDEGGMIISEPLPGATGLYAMVGVGEKGCADLKFKAKSFGGHASMPPKNTPLVRLGKFMAEVEKKHLFESKLNDVTAEMFKRIAPQTSGVIKLILGHPRFFKKLIEKVLPAISPSAGAMLKTTIAFTTAQGSSGLNVIPSEAYVTGNMRYSHHEGGSKSIEKISKLASKYKIETEIIDPGLESKISKIKDRSFNLIEEAIGEIYPDVIVAPYVMTGASDSRFIGIVSDYCFRFLPFVISDEQLASIHGINECLDIECLDKAVEFYKIMLRKEI